MDQALQVQDISEMNHLLRSLAQGDRELLLPHLKPITLHYSQILYEQGDDVRYTYFPCGPTLVSYVVLLADSRGVEAALIGHEGAVGGIVSQGHLPAYCRAIVQFPGIALRIDTAELERSKQASPNVRHFFARYADCLFSQVFQSVACNATHTIEQRTAKWLIAAIERTGEKEVPLTQEQLSGMLGVGRSYVGRVMAHLKTQGVLETRRGRLRIHNFEGLKSRACQCNELVAAHYATVMAGVYPQSEDKAKTA